ncbi:MAG TPA: DUF1043 family protein [Alcanivoracaceae bacterium]|nr:DUF1043 family protein [Alcanivoracaceae bacterium]
MSLGMQMALLFAGGALLGFFIAYIAFAGPRSQKGLKKERDEALQQLKAHQEKVDQHFLRTAELVNQLTFSYRAVHEQLSEGARSLCTEQGRNLAMSSAMDNLPGYPGERAPAPIQQPLDYAPTAKGTLAEDFGLQHQPPKTPLFTPVDLTKTETTTEPTDLEQPLDYAEEFLAKNHAASVKSKAD